MKGNCEICNEKKKLGFILVNGIFMKACFECQACIFSQSKTASNEEIEIILKFFNIGSEK